jgi:two-component system response regulator AtoC
LKVLVVDDELNVRESIRKFLEIEKFDVGTAVDGNDAVEKLSSEVFDLVLTDLRMPNMDGHGLMEWINEAGIKIPIIIISAHGDIQDAVKAMKAGAFDYLTKPFDPDELILRMNRAVETGAFQKSREIDQMSLGLKDDLIAEDPLMLEILTNAKQAAASFASILITGSSGTGKEVMARYIHEQSSVSNGPFVPVNLGSIPESLAESELFGHERGAFTGADKQRRGYFELANNGTLFLDEIGEMPLNMQVKLLRVLQERKLQRVGGTIQIPVHLRIIAATNKNLEEEVREKRFREDLFYRLNVVRFELPALRERPKDIEALSSFFIQKFGKLMGKPDLSLSEPALKQLQNYDFPGNVRELENIIERACIFASDSQIQSNHLGLSTMRPLEKEIEFTEQNLQLWEIEKAYIKKVLSEQRSNRTKTAEVLGISRQTLIRKIQELDLE